MSTVQTNRIQHSSATGNNIILSADGDTQVNSLNGGQLAGFRNQLINGNFLIWQRGTSAQVTASTAVYVADRWQVSTSATGGVTRNTAPAGLPFDYVIQFSQNGTALRQGIELAVNAAGNGLPGPFVPGSTWTLSVYANWDMSGITPVIAFRDTLSDAAGQTKLAVPTPSYQAIGPAVEGYTRYSTTIIVDAGVTPGTAPMLAIVVVPDAGSIPDGSSITGCQFEPGPVATPFEHRFIGTELALCQRYYVAGEAYIRAAPQGSTRNGCSVFFPAFMRAVPTNGASTKAGFGNTLAIDYVTNSSMVGTGVPNAVGELFFSYNADAEL